VLDLFKKIAEELNKIPEIKERIQPLNDVCSTLLKAKELDDEAEKLKKAYVSFIINFPIYFYRYIL
jgi:uncharacterized protein YjgD (DUF1641 family)